MFLWREYLGSDNRKLPLHLVHKKIDALLKASVMALQSKRLSIKYEELKIGLQVKWYNWFFTSIFVRQA